MKVKAIKSGSISYNGVVLAVSIDQVFEGEFFEGLKDLYSEMFIIVEDTVDSVGPKKVTEVKEPKEPKEPVISKEIVNEASEISEPVKEGLLDSVKKVFKK